MTKEKDKKNMIILVVTLIILLLIIFLVISRNIRKIGYENTSTESSDIILVTENDVGWDLLEELNIFSGPEYKGTPIIKPGDYGVYSFVVSNTTNENLIYDVQLREINEYGINMKYKLKLENIYVAGNKDDWKDIEDVGLESVIVAPNSCNMYTLEWCWIDNDKEDTRIGKLNYAYYTLRLKVGAQIYEKNTGVD